MALLGWVPGTAGNETGMLPDEKQPRFIHNKSGRFESRWATVTVQESPAIMLKVCLPLLCQSSYNPAQSLGQCGREWEIKLCKEEKLYCEYTAILLDQRERHLACRSSLGGCDSSVSFFKQGWA